MHWVKIIGPLLAISAFMVFGRGMVRRANGKSFNPLGAFLLILSAISFRFLLPSSLLEEHYQFIHNANLFNRLCLMLADIGIGMVIASFYLRANKDQPKLFWVPGGMAIIISLFIYGISLLVNSFNVNEANSIEFVVELGPDDHLNEIKPILEKYEAKYWKAFKNVSLSENENLAQTYIVCVDPMYQDLLQKELTYDKENVDVVELNGVVKLFEPTTSTAISSSTKGILANDPFVESQWHFERLQYNEVHKILSSTKAVKKARLAIVDTGVDSKHEDINAIFQPSPGKTDKHSHGTHCAGIAGAATNNGIGVGSLNWEGKYLDISGFKALDDYGRGTDETVARAIIDAAESGADVISMSLGGLHPRPPRVQSEAVKYALSLGAIVVVAAGNSNDDATKYSPANIPGVIVVGAVNEKLEKAPFSNTNTKLKMPIAAPGVNIYSSIPNDKYQGFSGTSMATPMVAGLLGIMKSFKPDMEAEEAYNILKKTGTTTKATPKLGKVISPLEAIKSL